MTMPSADIQETVNMKISLIRQTNTFSLQVKKGFYQKLMRLRICVHCLLMPLTIIQ